MNTYMIYFHTRPLEQDHVQMSKVFWRQKVNWKNVNKKLIAHDPILLVCINVHMKFQKKEWVHRKLFVTFIVYTK